MNSGESQQPAAAATFGTTHWSVVLQAGGVAGAASAEAALARLCEAYWYPLYAHIRRRGHDAETARDLTQGLFAELLAKDGIARARAEKGRFRSFLMKAADNHLHAEHRNQTRLKRGGAAESVSFDAEEAEERWSREPADAASPDREYDKRWARVTLERVRHRLRAEFTSSGRVELFDLLRPHLFGDLEAVPYAEVARRTNLTVVAIKQTTFRLRRRFGELLRAEVAQTLADTVDVDQELRHLIEILE